MIDNFAKYHPIVNFLYFALVIGLSMVLTHPISQMISFLCACTYAIQIQGKKAVTFTLKFCLPSMVLMAVFNPAFSHGGITVLTYLPTGNPLTLESILYGLSAGLMLATVIMWFMNFNRVITSDKFIYLFGKIIPALSLVLSMTLRFVPKFKNQMNTVIEAQKSIGRDIYMGSIWERAKTAITVLSIMITWSLENAIETADSMKSRGYGLKGRSAFSIYILDKRDKKALCFLLVCGMVTALGMISHAFAFRYYPSIIYADLNLRFICFQLVYFVMCSMPVVLNIVEERKWKSIHSKI